LERDAGQSHEQFEHCKVQAECGSNPMGVDERVEGISQIQVAELTDS
jgi:hypothetical protein